MTDSLLPNSFPQLDATTLRQFSSYCAPANNRSIDELRTEVRTHVAHIRDHLRDNEFLDVSLAGQLAARLDRLLQEIATYPPDDQRLIVGAARYFIADDDAEPDTQSILGLEDDLAVFNSVVTQIGAPEMRIEV